MKTILTFHLVLLFTIRLSAQAPDKKIQFAIGINEVFEYRDATGWSDPGYHIYYQNNISSRVGIGASLAMTAFNLTETTTIPFLVGPVFKPAGSKTHDFQIHLAGGITGNIGNDYAAFFAAAETGVQYIPKNKGMMIELYWGQSMVMHPSNFSYLKARLGYVF